MRWAFWRPEPYNPNDLWEAFPYMRGKAYVELYPPLHPRTGEYMGTPGRSLTKIVLPELIRPGSGHGDGGR